PADPRRSTSSRTAAARSAWIYRRRPSRRWRTAIYPSFGGSWGVVPPHCQQSPSLEVPLPLAVFHRGFAGPVVRAGLATLGDAGRGDLRDHLGDGHRPRRHRAGAGHVPDGAVPDGGGGQLLVLAAGDVLVVGEQDAVPVEDLPLVREVDRGDLKFL